MSQLEPALPTVTQGVIGIRTVKTVNTRDIHAYLQVGKDFSTWIKERIGTFGFVEGEDFVTYEDLSSPISGSAKARTQTTIEYALTLDMGKELGMVDRSDRGREIRRYFLACEVHALGLDESAPLPPQPHRSPSPALLTREAVSTFESYFAFGGLIGLDRNQSILSANRATRKAVGVDLMADMETLHLTAPQQAACITPTDIGIKLGMSAIAVNKLMISAGMQTEFRDGKGRPVKEPTEKGKPFAVWQDTEKRNVDGTPVRQLKWSSDVVEVLRAEMSEATS